MTTAAAAAASFIVATADCNLELNIGNSLLQLTTI